MTHLSTNRFLVNTVVPGAPFWGQNVCKRDRDPDYEGLRAQVGGKQLGQGGYRSNVLAQIIGWRRL